MNLLYKPDWEETKERYEAWWAGECIGRCAISVVAPKDDLPHEPHPKAPDKVEDRWLDLDFLKLANEYRLSRTFFGGEALPVWHPGYPGWSFLPCYMGARVELDEATGWVYPMIEEGSLTDYDYREFVIDKDNPWWVKALEVLRFAAEESKDRCLTTVGAFGGCGDTLAAIRGTAELLVDLMDCPEYVRDFDQHLMKVWIEAYEAFYNIIREASDGSTCWFELWSPGKFYAAQNDFAYMISPKMFRDVFLPTIEMQTAFLDHAVYHVDGVGNYAHIDALCELPRLRVLQILPGAGKPSPLHYMDTLKKVQQYGKNLHISISPNEVQGALENLSARGLFIQTWCGSEKEARELIRNCEKWSRDR